VQDCALIFPSRDVALTADGTVGMYQEPPASACPFDIYVWTPAGVAFDSNAPCGGEIGVEMGSSLNDGLGGIIVREMVCESEMPSPPPPPMMSPPSSIPGSSSSSISLAVSFVATLDSSAVWTQVDQQAYTIRIAQTLGVSMPEIEITCDGPGCQARRARALQASNGATTITTTIRFVGKDSITRAATVATTMNALRADFNQLEQIFGAKVLALSQPSIALPQSPQGGDASSVSSGISTIASTISGMAVGVSGEDSLLVPALFAVVVLLMIVIATVALRRFMRKGAASSKVQPSPDMWAPGPNPALPKLQRSTAPVYFKHAASESKYAA
jgi:hypothetical protein